MHELSMDLNAVLRHAVEAGASDVHLKVGQPPVLRSDGELAPAADFGLLDDADLTAILDQVAAAYPRRRELFDETGDLDIAYSEPAAEVSRQRLCQQAISSRSGIPDQIPGFDDLHLPPGVARLAREQRGPCSSPRHRLGQDDHAPRCSTRSIARGGSIVTIEDRSKSSIPTAAAS
jgi:twitching motility protein PilT